LGWVFLDKDNNEIVPNGENLFAIQKIVPPNTSHLKSDITITVACDVNAPLFGFKGAAQVFSPQKGATAEMVVQLDNGLQHLAMVVKRDFGRDLAQVAGAGAAGGLGFGLLFFLNASLKEGIKIVMEQTHFAEHLTDANLVLTGEGKIDQQTLQGKLIAGIVQAANVPNVPVVALCGTLSLSPEQIQQLGLSYAVSILNSPTSLDEAIKHTYQGVRDSTATIVQFLKNMGKLVQTQ
jgi:glycerate kinase